MAFICAAQVTAETIADPKIEKQCRPVSAALLQNMQKAAQKGTFTNAKKAAAREMGTRVTSKAP
jgi:hypothetical protein